MFTSLEQFRTSDLWKGFRRNLIEERRNKEDGVLYSEYSGKPIADAKDAILHHKQHLTLQNVNDYSISLNPQNILIVTTEEHNEIHRRFGYGGQRKVYLVYGAPCSGKTSYVMKMKGNSDIVVDIDLLWYALTGVRYHKPNALKQNVFELHKCLKDMVKTRYPRQGWERAFIIMGGAIKRERDDIVKDFGAEPIYIDTPKEECLRRLANDEERRPYQEQWKQFIEEWFKTYQP